MGKAKLIILAGSVGVGKSTFGEYITQRLRQAGKRVLYIPESIDYNLLNNAWNAQSYDSDCTLAELQDAYNIFQTDAFDRCLEYYNHEFIDQHSDQYDYMIWDRGPWEQIVFMRAQHTICMISDGQMSAYLTHFYDKIAHLPVPDYVFFITASVDVCYKRNLERCKDNEYRNIEHLYTRPYHALLQKEYLKVLELFHRDRITFVNNTMEDFDRNVFECLKTVIIK